MVGRKSALSEEQKQDIINEYLEYVNVYPEYQKLQRIIKTQNPRAISRKYGVSYAVVRYVLGLVAPKIRLGNRDLSILEPQQRQVLELRKNGYTLESIGKIMGMSRQAVHQIQTKAVRHLTK